jgi:hypothetical protein
MSINKTQFALALSLALAACSSDEKAQNANAPAAAAQSAAPVAAGTPAAVDAAAQAANAANTPAATATDAAAGNSAAMATGASGDSAGTAIQSQDLNTPGFSADLVEASRSDGVLSVKLRLKNTGTKADQIRIYKYAKAEAFYVQAESKKYMVLTDTENAPLASPSDAYDGTLSPSIQPGASFTWWAKYPAPPADVKKFSFYWPLGAPFDDVPITDK